MAWHFQRLGFDHSFISLVLLANHITYMSVRIVSLFHGQSISFSPGIAMIDISIYTTGHVLVRVKKQVKK
jgi:hypothetical protein